MTVKTFQTLSRDRIGVASNYHHPVWSTDQPLMSYGQIIGTTTTLPHKDISAISAMGTAKAGKLKRAKAIRVVATKKERIESDRLERIEAIQFEIYRQIIEHDGGNDFKMPHSGIRKRQNNDLGAVDPIVTTDLYNRMRATILELRTQG